MDLSFTVLIFFTLASSSFSFLFSDYHRTISYDKAPGCVPKTNYSCNINLFYVKAVGRNDTIHYLWDYSSQPSLLLVHTSSENSLQIDWDAYTLNQSNSVRFISEPHYSFMVIFDKLLEFNDTHDTGFISSDSKNVSYNLDQFEWRIIRNMSEADDLCTIELMGANYNDKTLSLLGAVSMELITYGMEDHDEVLPRLLHSANSSQGRIQLTNLSSNSGFSQTRWALELIIITSDWMNETLKIEKKPTLDDENAPGVFAVYNIVSPWVEDENRHSGFVQWRPVAYTASIPSITNSSDVAVMDPMDIVRPDFRLNRTFADKYFGTHLKSCLTQSTFISFGSSQDGFYRKTNFTSWSFLMSYGSPRSEGLSMLIVLVMAIGLGLPALLIVVGAVFLFVRRFTNNTDELSLEG